MKLLLEDWEWQTSRQALAVSAERVAEVLEYLTVAAVEYLACYRSVAAVFVVVFGLMVADSLVRVGQ